MKIIRCALMFFSLLAGCQKGGHRSDHSAETPFLQISFQGDVRSLDPRIGIDYPSAYASKMLFEGLMRMGPDGQVQPAIAESYEISKDKKTYTFHLRACKWSNGEPITADDFAYAWRQIISPNNEFTLGVENFYPVKNVRKVINGELPVDEAGIEVLDDSTLRVELAHPTPYFLEVTATPSYFPVNARVDQTNPNWANRTKTFVSNGPFLLKDYSLENELVVKRNPDYWDAKSVKLPGIQIAIIKDSTTQLSLFEKNQLEWLGKPISRIPLDAMENLQAKGKVQFSKTLGLYWFFLNTETLPFQNKKMRQAFAHAINRQAIIDHILKGGEIPAMGLLPDPIATQKKPFFKDNDVEKARALLQEGLDELGMSKEELPAIVYNFNVGAGNLRLAQALQQQWKEAFGIEVRLEQQDWKFHYEKLQKGQYQIGGMQWQSWLRDPIYIMQTFRYKNGGLNMSRWGNEEYSRLINAAEEEADLEKRKGLFNQAETLIMEEMPVIPVYFCTMAYTKSDRLKNVYISELYEVDFRWATIEE